MNFKFRYQELGAHTHVSIWAGKNANARGKCGDVVFRNEEWAVFLPVLQRMAGLSAQTGVFINFENLDERAPDPRA